LFLFSMPETKSCVFAFSPKIQSKSLCICTKFLSGNQFWIAKPDKFNKSEENGDFSGKIQKIFLTLRVNRCIMDRRDKDIR